MLTIIIILSLVMAVCLLPVLKITEHKASKGTRTQAAFIVLDNSTLLRGKN